jgi:hypothetical protein
MASKMKRKSQVAGKPEREFADRLSDLRGALWMCATCNSSRWKDIVPDQLEDAMEKALVDAIDELEALERIARDADIGRVKVAA